MNWKEELVQAVPTILIHLLPLAILSYILPLAIHHISTNPNKFSWIIPTFLSDIFHNLFPISELADSYHIIREFYHSDDLTLLQNQLNHLLFVTTNIQMGLGYLGIGFLKGEQNRRNQLIRMEFRAADSEEGEESKKKKMNKEEEEDIRQKQQKAARKFRNGAPIFILFTVFPYMFQIIFFGNVNQFAFSCWKDDVHRTVRLDGLFENDANFVLVGSGGVAGGVAGNVTENNGGGGTSLLTPAAYGSSMDTVVQTSYDLFNRKLFSVPKLMLLPGVLIKQPTLLLKVFPFIFLSDFIKARMVATFTSEIERLNKEQKEMQAKRNKIESFDLKSSHLLHQSSPLTSLSFTRHKWQTLTHAIQTNQISQDLLIRTRSYFSWLQRNFIFSALIDVALANLISVGRIVSAEVFVFSRAIEDAVDLILMRSRAESELASMGTEVEKLRELVGVWRKESKGESGDEKRRDLMSCSVVGDDNVGDDVGIGNLVIENLAYSRGTALVRIPHLKLTPGIYAVTGANGSGKSTLFRVLMSCDTNDGSIDLPPSIVLKTPSSINPSCSTSSSNLKEQCVLDGKEEETSSSPVIIMPSGDVAEISQNFYWPLHTVPIDWIYQRHLSEELEEKRINEMARRVAEELLSLKFTQALEDVAGGEDDNKEDGEKKNVMSEVEGTTTSSDATLVRLVEQLTQEKDDWFGELSGGQKSKVELVRKVFLREQCPKVLLIDETMAPLDPTSKSMVMSKIKSFCSDSIVMVIYHTDVGRGGGSEEGNKSEGGEVECVPSNGFFDHNLHVENKVLINRQVC